MAADYEDHTRVHTTRKGEVPGGEQHGTGEHEEAGVAEGELEANAQPGALSTVSSLAPGVCCVSMRYPAPATVAMIQGSPRRLRSAETVMRTALVNGSAFSIPRPFQELLGADDTAFGGDEDLEHGELLPGQRDVAAVAVDLAAERIQPQACDLSHGWPLWARLRSSALSRSTSSWSSNGLVR